MSGFEFTIACSTCGLRAADYPWYRRLFSREIELPVVDADGLGRVCFVPAGPLTPEALLREAAVHLRDGQRALVPTSRTGGRSTSSRRSRARGTAESWSRASAADAGPTGAMWYGAA